VQSRFETTIGSISIAGENTAAARSPIADADFAVETAQLARQQILQNAGTAMVAQANSLPEQVLALIKAV
jgi:flagellin